MVEIRQTEHSLWDGITDDVMESGMALPQPRARLAGVDRKGFTATYCVQEYPVTACHRWMRPFFQTRRIAITDLYGVHRGPTWTSRTHCRDVG